AEPQVARGIGAQPERAGGKVALELGQRKLRDLAGFRIEPTEERFAEARIPGDAGVIDDHVVRLDGLAAEVIFGQHDARGAAGRPRQGLERVAPLWLLAQIDRRQILGETAVNLDALVAALL